MAAAARSCSAHRIMPLANLRVLDLGNFLAGPVVSLHLRAMGADVIKVEKLAGDDARKVGPFARDGESSYFLSLNRGKKSIALDLKSDSGKEILKKLCSETDVLIENFRPSVMERLGLSYEVLSAINPGLVYCSVSGFGQTGEHASRPAFDSLLQAAGGLISATGSAKEGEPPVRVGCSVIDMASGLHATIAVLGAIYHRTLNGGKGQAVDTSMLATTAFLMESPISRHSIGGEAYLPQPEGLAHPAVAPFDGYKTADGLLYIATSNDSRAHMCLKALGIEICDDFRTNTSRMANRDALKARMEEKLKKKTTEAWEKKLIPLGVPCSAINSIADLKDKHPEVFVEVDHPSAGKSLQAGGPFAFSGCEVDYESPSPLLGQHTDEILLSLGYTAERIAQLRDASAIL